MMIAGVQSPSTHTALYRGALERCPHCGEGKLFRSYLKIVDHCEVCGESYGHFRTDDAAPWLTIMIVGHLVIPFVLLMEQAMKPPLELMFGIWLPITVALTLLLLPRCKGFIAALMWSMKAEGSEKV